MATEAVIRQECYKQLAREGGWLAWSPPRSRLMALGAEKDIFGVFDVLAIRPGYAVTRYIQLTSLGNFAARRSKVLAWLDLHDIGPFWAEVWGWDHKHQTFRIERLAGGGLG